MNVTVVTPGGPSPVSSGDHFTYMTPPAATAVSTTETSGAYAAGTAIPITVAFSEAVTVTGKPQLALNAGGGAAAIYSGGSGASTLTFTYIAAAGQYTPDLDYASTTALTLNGGTIEDAVGNAATLTLPAPGADELAAKNVVVNSASAYADINGDGTSDVLYQYTNGSVGASLMKNGANNAWVGLSGPTSWKVVGLGDFNSDGTADVLYQNTDGSAGISLMKNGANNGWVALSGPTSWKVVGLGDLNGDGTSDVLWQNADGTTGASLMKNGAIIGWVGLSGPTAWKAVGVGDFNGDGTSDVLYQNTDGSVGISLMKNGANNAWVGLSGPTAWRVAGVGDFNGDGTSDVLWQNTDGSVGASLMKNGAIIGWVGLSGPTSWRAAGVGDINGDGTSDVLYQNTDGSVGASLMKNGANIGWVGLSGPTSWTVVGGGSPLQAGAATNSALIAAAPTPTRTSGPTPTTSSNWAGFAATTNLNHPQSGSVSGRQRLVESARSDGQRHGLLRRMGGDRRLCFLHGGADRHGIGRRQRPGAVFRVVRDVSSGAGGYLDDDRVAGGFDFRERTVRRRRGSVPVDDRGRKPRERFLHDAPR